MRANDLPTAQEILTAAGVTLPTGDLVNGAFDLTGNLYRCPAEIVSDPVNVITEGKEDALGLSDEPEDEDSDILAEQRREEKGKGNERDMVKVKCRLSDRGGPDETVALGRSQHVGVLSRRVASQAGIAHDFRVRIAYLGKILREDQTLEIQGWKEGHVLNALVVLNPHNTDSNFAARGGGG